MITHISSADNSRVKLVRKLASRKGRETESKFVAEGVNLVSELTAGNHEIEFLLMSESFVLDETNRRKQAILSYAEKTGCDACSVDDRIFSKLSDAEHGVDVMAVVRTEKLDASFAYSLPAGDNILVCDRLQDPGNMGTIIRTAVAAGYGAVMTLPGTVDVYSPKVLRATAGMVFEIPIISVKSEDELFDVSRKSGRKTAVTVPEGGTEYYLEDLSRDTALVIGNEGRGASKSIIDRADVKVTIPMKGNIESLNAATAASILMYETIRNNR